MKRGLIAIYFEICTISTLADLCSNIRSLLGICIVRHFATLTTADTESQYTTQLSEGASLLATSPSAVLSQLASHDAPHALSSAILALLHVAEAYGFSQYVMDSSPPLLSPLLTLPRLTSLQSV